ncbi:MAG: hypothetical protein ABJE95_11180 [Byssovorax sp.]
MSAADGPSPPDAAAIVAAGASTSTIATTTLPSGRRLEAELDATGADVLRIRAHDGQCVLTVRITDEGPVLSFSGASLELDARRLDIACDDLRVRVGGSAALAIGGDVDTRVAGHATHRIEGASRTEAQSLALAAHPGGITLEANDDVALKGERVLLNSDDPPMPLSMAEYRARRLAASESAPAKALDASEKPVDQD